MSTPPGFLSLCIRKGSSRPLAARLANDGAQEQFTLPHSTVGGTISKTHSHNPAPTARRFRAPARTAHPVHPNSGAPRGPPLPLSAWLLRHRSPRRLQRLPGITPAPPHPQPAPQREGDIGLQNLTLHRWSDCDPLHGPRRPRPPAAASWTPYQGALSRSPAPCAPGGGAYSSPRPLRP